MPRAYEQSRTLYLAGLLLLALLAAGTGYYAGRAYFQRSDAGAAPVFDPSQVPDTSVLNWYVPWKEWEAAQPRREMTLAGITVGPEVDQRGTPCLPGEATHVEPSAAAASVVAIAPAYLPAGARLQEEEAVACGGRVVSYYESYSLPTDELGVARAARGEVSLFEVAHGGVVEIFRAIADPETASGIPSYRWSEGTIHGKPAAIARPLTGC